MADEAWHSYIVGEARDGVVRMYDEPIEIAPAKPVTPEEFMRDVTVDDLIAFLNEQLASQKAMAVQAKRSLDEWQRGNDPENRWRLDEDGISINIRGEYVCVGPEVAVFLAFNDPDTVLAEVESKRQIIAACTAVLAVEGWEYTDAPDLAEATLRLLALPYVEDEDYRESWRPVD